LHQDAIPDGLLYKLRATGVLNVQQRFEKHKAKLLLCVSPAAFSWRWVVWGKQFPTFGFL